MLKINKMSINKRGWELKLLYTLIMKQTSEKRSVSVCTDTKRCLRNIGNWKQNVAEQQLWNEYFC